MTNQVGEFGREYRSVLENFLRTGDETALSGAYELGRRAMVEGLGILDMAELHRNALENVILPAPQVEQSRLSSAASSFFHEILSSFEMTFRGYRGANQELQRLNEALIRQNDAVQLANRELEAFSYSVSHDLRAPLRTIDGFSQVLLDDYADALDEEGKRCLTNVRAAAQRMAQLIDDLLGLARVTRAGIRRASVDLSALARRIAETLQGASPGRTLQFECEDGIRATCDARLVAVMLENLLGNAWKFTSKRADARVEFGQMEHEGRPAYFVRDNGAGFDMNYAGKLFAAFQRLHSAAEFEGTGIGLATVQRVVLRHSGKIWAEGAIGAGATFYFTLGENETDQ